MQIWSNPSRHCRTMTLPSSHCVKDSRADSSLGGGSPAYTVTAGGVEAPSDAIPTAIEDRPSCLPIASFPWSVFTAVSSQNGFPLSSRLHMVKPHRVSCTIAGAWARPSRRPWRLLVLYFGQAGPREKKCLPSSTCQPTTEIRTWYTPSVH
jgi:hypothetical protein